MVGPIKIRTRGPSLTSGHKDPDARRAREVDRPAAVAKTQVYAVYHGAPSPPRWALPPGQVVLLRRLCSRLSLVAFCTFRSRSESLGQARRSTTITLATVAFGSPAGRRLPRQDAVTSPTDPHRPAPTRTDQAEVAAARTAAAGPRLARPAVVHPAPPPSGGSSWPAARLSRRSHLSSIPTSALSSALTARATDAAFLTTHRDIRELLWVGSGRPRHTDHLDDVDDHGTHRQGPHDQRMRSNAMPASARRPPNRDGRHGTAPARFATALGLEISPTRAGITPPAQGGSGHRHGGSSSVARRRVVTRA